MTEQLNLNAVITRNIGDILGALEHAWTLSPRLWDEVGRAVQAATPDDWFASSDAEEEDVWLARRTWLSQDGDAENATFWLGLVERTAVGGEGEQSWLATFTASGPQGATLALSVQQRILGKSGWKKLLKVNAELVQKLSAAGFEQGDDDSCRLCLPVLIDREALAKAFEDEDFEAAFKPLADAVNAAVAAQAELDALFTLARTAAAA